MSAPASLRRLTVIIAVASVVVMACSPGSGASSGASTPATAAAPSAGSSTVASAPASAPASAASGTMPRIGYISGGDSDPFVLLVTEGLRAEAKKAGVELSECDSAFEAEKALTCARTLAAQDLDAMINWQFFPDSSEAVCEAYGGLPTVAIDTPEKPCQKTFVGANNRQAGLVAGTGLGEFAKAKFDCAYDAYISLDFPTIAEINAARAGGSVEGFEAVCGKIPTEKYFSVDTFAGGPDQPENSRRQVTDILTTLPDAKTILVISPAGDIMGTAALGAAEVAGRRGDVGSPRTARTRASASRSAANRSGSDPSATSRRSTASWRCRSRSRWVAARRSTRRSSSTTSSSTPTTSTSSIRRDDPTERPIDPPPRDESGDRGDPRRAGLGNC